MRWRALTATLALLSATQPATAASWIEGVVSHVRDGDTLVVDRWVVRLQGLHALERRAPGGETARHWMIERALGRTLVCRPSGRRSFDRMVAVCFHDGGDLARQLIASGLGRDCPRFSGGRYAADETAEGRGLALPVYCQPRTAAGRTAAPTDAGTSTSRSHGRR